MIDDLTLARSEAGRAYLAEVMKGERGLCGSMRNRICEAGDVYAIVPKGTAAKRFEQVEQFEYGGLTRMCASQAFLLERIANRGNVGRPGVLLVQDLWAAPRHYTPDFPSPSYFVNDDSVYLWADTDDVEYVRACLRRPISFNFVAYLVPDPVAAQQFCEGIISAEALAPAIPELYSPAYDQESFVIWSRAD